MKLLRFLMIVSLVANVALLALVGLRSVRVAIGRINFGGQKNHSSVVNASSDEAHPAPLSQMSLPASSTVQPDFWAELQTENLDGLKERLLAAGFPLEITHAIVSERVKERFRMRHREFAGPVAELSYWKNESRTGINPATRDAFRKLMQEQNELLNRLLGPDHQLQNESYTEIMRRQFGELPDAKLARVHSITKDYSELERKVREGARTRDGRLSETDEKTLLMLEQEKRADLARVLGPAELLELDLRSSLAADRIRRDARFFDCTEAEFRALFPAYQARFEPGQPLPTSGGASPEQKAVADHLLAEARKVLSADRYEIFALSRDAQHAKLFQIVRRLELPLSVARAVVMVQDEVTARANAVKANATQTTQQRGVQLASLSQEAVSRMTDTLGARGFSAYERYSGKWLQALQTPANESSPAP
jgi:hypothetical protein